MRRCWRCHGGRRSDGAGAGGRVIGFAVLSIGLAIAWAWVYRSWGDTLKDWEKATKDWEKATEGWMALCDEAYIEGVRYGVHLGRANELADVEEVVGYANDTRELARAMAKQRRAD